MILDAGYRPVFDEPGAVSDDLRRFVDRDPSDIAPPDHDAAVPEVRAALKVSVRRSPS
jgi:hypothetical protein